MGSMGRRGNPYDNAMIESFMTTLKIEGAYPLAFESADDVVEHLPRSIDSDNDRRRHSALGYFSPNRFEEEQPRTSVKTLTRNRPTQGPTQGNHPPHSRRWQPPLQSARMPPTIRRRSPPL